MRGIVAWAYGKLRKSSLSANRVSQFYIWRFLSTPQRFFDSTGQCPVVEAKVREFNPLAEKLYPTRHIKIGSAIDAGLRIHAFCLDCGHDEDLDLREVPRKEGSRSGQAFDAATLQLALKVSIFTTMIFSRVQTGF
jgi:hypothetical protein